ncbi:MAG: hypothetical protein IJ572_02065 [Bacilli bacterium]|nr:hypothetical protein [Bacilli bacterium]
MKKAMLMLGMVGGSALTFMVMNKNVRDMMQKKMNCAFDSANKMFDN